MWNYPQTTWILTLTTGLTLGLIPSSSALPGEWQPTAKSTTQPQSIPSHPSTEPLDLLALEQLDQRTCNFNVCPSSAPGVNGAPGFIPSPKQPSLWLYRDLFKPGLIQNWLIYPKTSQEASRVDFVLNRNIWTVMDYLERYAFVNAMGAVTRKFGYNSRFFSVQQNNQNRLATYTCNFLQAAATCKLMLESIGLNRFR